MLHMGVKDAEEEWKILVPERDKSSCHHRMGDRFRGVPGFFTHVDGEGAGNESGFSVAHGLIFAEHDSRWSDLLAAQGTI